MLFESDVVIKAMYNCYVGLPVGAKGIPLLQKIYFVLSA